MCSNSAASSTEPLVMPALPYALRLRLERICFGVQHLQHLHHARTAAGSSSQQQGRDKVKTNVGNEREATSARQGVLDFVSIAFPALYVPVRDVFSSFKTEAVIASSAAGDHASAASALSTVMDLLARGQILRNNHAWPAKESFDVLDEANTLADEIFRAPVNTRLAAVCLLATAALSAFRLPELQRLEAVIAFSFWSAHSIQADWLRAAHWLQLEVSLLCGAACGGWTGVEPALSSPDAGSTVVHLQSQLVYQHHQQKRLEYGIQQAFSSEVLLYESCSFDGSHGEAIWHLVREIWSLAQTVETEIERDRNTPSPISLHVHVALLRYKLLIQIYSSFPRQLLLSIVSDEHKFAWIDTAQTMALRALSLYHLCAAQFGWLGDSYLDAHRFAELLVRQVAISAFFTLVRINLCMVKPGVLTVDPCYSLTLVQTASPSAYKSRSGL
ncbi:hypothetical protein BCV70DRAFT_115770 [Testicularia cyperi]|uniref:Transcription factor domain-containing protein n=1 Tax=Testicularia cyperi TaxID=1882483 RepID=A0A317XN29_9BASI|nr:hypothetical protein BCV70DRAFT_115770 [Testicularia cyperi]